jgi:hypothetical protein
MSQPSPDMISAGPRTVPPRLAWLTAVVLLAAALAGAVLLALHYRSETAALRSARAYRSAGPVAFSATITALPSAGPLAGEVTAVAIDSNRQAQVIVTARVTGGHPHSRYELSGGDCTGNAADQTWAAGTTGADGSADLTGHSRAVWVSHEYYLVLSAPGLYQEHPGPAVHGWFGSARGLSAVRGGAEPCAPGCTSGSSPRAGSSTGRPG